MISVVHNMAAMNAQRLYGQTTTTKAKTTEKLSSGYKINRAADDAAGLTISEKMRSLIRGLNQGSDNIQDGISLTQLADGALAEIHDMLHREEELLVKGANGTNTEADKEAIQKELDQLNKEIDRAFETTEFNTIKVFKGKREIVGDINTSSTPGPTSERSLANTSKTEKLVWIDKGVTPPAKKVDTNDESYSTKSVKTTIEDNKIGTDSDGKDLFLYKKTDVVSEFDITKKTTTTEEYIKQTDTDYAKAKEPNVSATGYMNFSTNGGIALSCAMSQLAISLSDGTPGGYSFNSNDMCSDKTVSKNTTAIADGYQTVYSIAVTNTDGTTPSTFEVVQIAKKNAAGNGYDISFSTKNNSDRDLNVDVKFALDTANTYGVSNPANKSRANAGGDASNYTITGENFRTTINSSGASAAVLNSINTLYNRGVADKADIGTTYVDGSGLADHTGLGVWYEKSVNAGESKDLGGVTYTVEYLKDPYLFTTTVEVSSDSKEVRKDTTNVESYQYTLEPLFIQCSNLVEDNIPIDLFNLSTSILGIRSGIDVDVHNFATSMDNISRVTAKISDIRSYYGAVTNKLEHAYNNNTNKAENTTAAESRIRDTDMAAEMVKYSMLNILQQAGESMMAQANQSNQGVLNLLQ